MNRCRAIFALHFCRREKPAAELGLRRVPELEVEFPKLERLQNPLPLVRSVIAVGAGKGGVGKAPWRFIWRWPGPNRPQSWHFGRRHLRPLANHAWSPRDAPKIDGNTIIPFEKDGLKVVRSGVWLNLRKHWFGVAPWPMEHFANSPSKGRVN